MARVVHVIVSLFFIFILSSYCEECPPERLNIERSWEEKLEKEHINKKLSDKNFKDLNVNLILRLFNFGFDEEIFSYHGKSVMTWTEKCFAWKPEDYGGIREVIVSRFWTPPFDLLNGADGNDYYNYNRPKCRIQYDGEVTCVTIQSAEVMCRTQLKDWPFDTQNCTLKFGSPDIYVNYTLSYSTMLTAGYGDGWIITDYSTGKLDDVKGGVYLTLSIIREGEDLAALVVYQIGTLAALTLLTLVFGDTSEYRYGILIFSILCHVTVLTNSSSYIPSYGDDVPLDITFIKNSIIINCFLIIFTYILARVRLLSFESPIWLNTFNIVILNSGYKYVVVNYTDSDCLALVSSDIDNEDSVKTLSKHPEWNNFANILNSFVQISIPVVYICMLSVCIPTFPTYT